MKKSARQDKGAFVHQLTEKVETAAGKRDTKRLRSQECCREKQATLLALSETRAERPSLEKMNRE